MRISVVIHSPTVVTVTRVPGWIGRLFGQQESTREATDVSGRLRAGQWVWSDTECFVENDVERAIEQAFDGLPVRP